MSNPNLFLKHNLAVFLTAIVAMTSQTSIASANTQIKIEKDHTTNQTHLRHYSTGRPQVWINNIGTLLFNDNDGDGFHSGFSITIDVDSDYGDTEVYANIYLRSELSPLNLLFRTAAFPVYGYSINDEYRIDTELQRNFPSDQYDVVIDIHDAWSDELLDTANPRAFSNLSQLPLESTKQQQALDQHSSGYYDLEAAELSDHQSDIIVTEFAGSLHPLLFTGLFGSWLIRRRYSHISV